LEGNLAPNLQKKGGNKKKEKTSANSVLVVFFEGLKFTKQKIGLLGKKSGQKSTCVKSPIQTVKGYLTGTRYGYLSSNQTSFK